MNLRKAPKPSHPAVETLALFASADLALASRWRVARHVAHCGDCEQQVLWFRSSQMELRREAVSQTLTGFEAITDWTRLEREMLGNIAVGLSAARCIENVGKKPSFYSRLALAGGLVLLFALGWVTHIPREETDHVFAALRAAVGLDRPQTISGPVLRTSREGIAVRTQGSTLTILHPASAVVSFSGASAVEARYIDEDTGQVTITNVYGQ